MSRNSSASVFGGAGGRGVRSSVSSLQGLRKIMGNDTETDSAPITPVSVAPVNSSEPPADSPPKENKQELQDLNNRLKGYVKKVQDLKKKNKKLQEEIDDILGKREAPEGRDWNKIQEPLDNLEKEIKQQTHNNASALLQNQNLQLALEDFTDRRKDETKLKKKLEKDLEKLKKENDDIKEKREDLQDEIKLIKEELECRKQEHQEEVKNLHEKIVNSEVKVEIESNNTNLAKIVKDTRDHYQKVAEKNQKATDSWYKTKVENIKEKDTKNTEAFECENKELKKLQKELKCLQMQIQASHTTIYSLEESLNRAKEENNQRLIPLNNIISRNEEELKAVKAEVEQKVENYKELLCIKMRLQKEIEEYNKLIQSMTAEAERSAMT